MNIRQDILTWLNQCLNSFGFKQLKSLPALGVVKEWGGDQSKGVFQVFVNHDGFLNVYMNESSRGTSVFRCEVPNSVESYEEAAKVSNEEIAEIMKKSKDDALNDQKYLDDKSRLEMQIRRKKAEVKMSLSELLGFFAESSYLVYNGDDISVDGVGVLEGDFLLANSDRTGVLVSNRNGWSSVIGDNTQYFSLIKSESDRWIFFTNSAHAIPRLQEITASTVVYYKDQEMLEEIAKNKQSNLKFVVFADSNGIGANNNESFKYVYPHNQCEKWSDCLIGGCDINEVRSHLRAELSKK